MTVDRKIINDLDFQGVQKVKNAVDATSPQDYVTLNQLQTAVPDPTSEPDGEWLMTSSGAAVWVPAAADLVPITDTGGYFTSTDVEGALQELGAIPVIAYDRANSGDYLDITTTGDDGLGHSIQIHETSPSSGGIQIFSDNNNVSIACGGNDVQCYVGGVQIDGGLLSVFLDAGGTFIVNDSLGNPILQMTEGSPDLHLPTGGNVIFDL